MNNDYKNQVALLIRIMPSIYRIQDFAVHGGTAINLFYKNMPRYSVDIDLTYIPILDREESLRNINNLLVDLKGNIEKTIPGIRIIHKPDVLKLLCTKDAATVKIEVNNVKRGLLEPTTDMLLCENACKVFSQSCKARIVSFSQLYGGKIAAALSRQHPRDLFDCKYMEVTSFEDVKKGFFLALLGADKPTVEMLAPNPINQKDALQNQFDGMSDIDFSYEDYCSTRENLIKMVNYNINSEDKAFLLTYEQGNPDWSKCCTGDLDKHPSVMWKQQNIRKLKEKNTKKFNEEVSRLEEYFRAGH